MYKDYEVLRFSYDLDDIKLVEKLEHFDKAPYGLDKKDNIDMALFRFFNVRTIPFQRPGYEEILKATNCDSSLELSFKGHGLSLSNHYWFKREGENLKYDDINFFTNKWDDTFGRLLLKGDYAALKDADLNVPDIVTSGWGAKGWIYNNGPKLYKQGIDNGNPEEAICEALASKVARRILKENEVVRYDLDFFEGKYASVSSPVVGMDENLVPLSNVLPHTLYGIYREMSRNKDLQKKFFEEVVKVGLPDLYDFFVKVSCLRTLLFVSDLHFDNLSFIHDQKTGELKMAPIIDLGGSFGSSKSGREFIKNFNKGSFILIYFIFSGLNPDWDYSWYNPDSLIGVEDDIKEFLSKTNFYTPELVDRVIEVYHHQKESLDEAANNSK